MALIITTDYVTDETFFFYQSTATHIKSANDDNSNAFIIDELINSKDKHSANIRRNFLMRVKCFVFFLYTRWPMINRLEKHAINDPAARESIACNSENWLMNETKNYPRKTLPIRHPEQSNTICYRTLVEWFTKSAGNVVFRHAHQQFRHRKNHHQRGYRAR